ncbi:fibronectin type III domain-containing protein [Anaeromicropila populeti]|uniref:Fibronectin type III domain-containing protein n=1 Tax=Anaeromicropila populeti TaxID=37658 RepID=A0A1I6HVK1_9FIRM|nr:fibronectin type III domain-containing protein [Anaeromicropila populeti]SFR58471.1 Fibronectin type III domain-containing protein [Anaeromicropila populeti]
MKKIRAFLVLMAVFMLCSIPTGVSAATVGQLLTAPEDGWVRYDDQNSYFYYDGNWSLYECGKPTNGYMGKFMSSPTTGDSVKFKFQGTELRLISILSNNLSKNVEVKIDDVVVGNYSIYRSSITSGICLLYEVTGLENGNHYVELTKSDSNSSFIFDAIDINDTGTLLPYDKVEHLAAVPGDSKATLTWNAVANTTGYTVKWGTTHGEYTYTQTVSSDAYTGYDVTGLTNGTTYYFTVSATVNGEEGKNADEVSATPVAEITEAPVNLKAIAGDEQVTLTWNTVKGADSYTIKCGATAGGPYTQIATSNTPTYVHTGLTNGTTYYYVVSAVNTGGESADSNEASATPEEPVLENATLVITLDGGTIKEYNLTGEELDDFLTWYDNRSAGAAKAYYIFTWKSDVSPYTSIKDYIPYSKILYFTVKNYNV